MIVWKRSGILVVIVGFVVMLITQLLVEAALGDGYFTDHVWPTAVGGFAAGPLIWLIGRRSNSPARSSPWSDDEAEDRGTLYWIPTEYWAVLWPVVVTLFALLNSDAF